METQLDCVSLYKKAWKSKDFEQMLLLIKEHSDVAQTLHCEERRVFTWMSQATRMGDVATNVISFWLIEEYLRSSDPRKVLIQKYNARLKMLVTIALQTNLFLDLLENLTKQQQASVQAALVLIQLLSANIEFAQNLQGLCFSPKSDKCGLLESFVEILRDYVNDHQKSSHVRLLSAASLINLYSLMNFNDSEDQEVTIPDDTSVSSLSGERGINASKSRVSDLTHKTSAKSYFAEPDLEIEAERVKQAILNDLFVLIKELSQTQDCWERSKSKASTLVESFESWEVSELVKSIIRLYGSIQAAKVLSSKTFTKFFELQNFEIKPVFRRIRKDLEIEYKYLINSLDEGRLLLTPSESKETNKSCVEVPPPTLSPRAHSPRNSNKLEQDHNEEQAHKRVQLMKLSKMLTSLLETKTNQKIKMSRRGSLQQRTCASGCKLCTIF